MTAPDPHLTGLARGGALNLAGAAAAGVFGIALVAIVTNGYPAGVAGAFFAAISVFLILSAVCELGSDAGLVRWVPRYLAWHRHDDARRVLRVALPPVLVVACAAALAVFAAATWIADLFTDTSTAQVAGMLWILAAFLPIAALHNSVLAGTRGHGTMRPTVLVERLGRQGGQVAAVAAVQAAGGGPEVLALAWSAPYLLGLIVAAGWLARLSRLRARPDEDTPTALPHRQLAAEFWRYTGPRALARICQVALQRVDIVLVAALSSPRDAAIYTAATRFVVLGQLGVQAVQQVMQPTVSRLLALDDHPAAARIFGVSTAWTMALTWPVYIAVAVAAPVYLSIFGPGYRAAGLSVVVILALTMLLATAAGPADVMLLMAGRSGLSLMNNAAALAVNVAFNVLLIPSLGVTGAAISWSAAIVVRNALPVAQIRSLLGMSPVSSGAAWIAGSAIGCFAVLPLATNLVVGPRPLPLLASLIPCVAGYAVLAWVGRDRIALFALAGLLRRRTATATGAAR